MEHLYASNMEPPAQSRNLLILIAEDRTDFCHLVGVFSCTDRQPLTPEQVSQRNAGIQACPQSITNKENELMISTELVDLSRLQFAVTALYHFLFVPLTLGMTLMLVIMELLT